MKPEMLEYFCFQGATGNATDSEATGNVGLTQKLSSIADY